MWNTKILSKQANDVYSKNNLPKIKDGAYVKKHDEYKSIGTYWIALNVDSFEVEYVPKDI